MSSPLTITFYPSGIAVEANPESTISALAKENGLWVESSCGSAGRCRSCLVRIESDSLPEPNDGELSTLKPEELAMGWRRACQTKVTESCSVYLNTQSDDATIKTVSDVSKIGFGQYQQRLQRYSNISSDKALPEYLNGDLGLAVDLGTTNISATLIELSTGRIRGEKELTNPQVYFGADVISRLHYGVSKNKNIAQMQKAVIEAINKLADELTSKDGGQIRRAVITGNTVMHHIFHKLPLGGLAASPYTPEETKPLYRQSDELGLKLLPDTLVYTPANIGCFIGGDHLSALVDIMTDSYPNIWVMIDIGTNTEIALYVNGDIYSCSCASGPAFEGGHLSCGTRARSGAIQSIDLESDLLSIDTIDNDLPIGICGSGIISVMANLCRNKLLNKRGRLLLESQHVVEKGGSREFVLHKRSDSQLPIVFSQKDIRSVQLAKAAIRTGLELLFSEAGIGAEDVENLYLAGNFGSYIDISDAIDIGLLPDIPKSKIRQVGNAAQRGAGFLLLSPDIREMSKQVAKSVNHLDLASIPEFQRTFIRCNQFEVASNG